MNLMRRNILLMLLMLASSGLAIALYPTQKIADKVPGPDLETMIPKQFGDWKLDESLEPIKINPEVQARLDKIYNQTLSRTYVNSHGDRIMLSIAYGGDQSSALQVHRPEVCYTAQGFLISKMDKGFLKTANGQIPVLRMVASQQHRTEPITYWITVGNKVVRGAWEQKLAKVKYGLTGKVPDGILVRVSNISSDTPGSYRLHQDFVNEMLKGMRAEDRSKLVGIL